MTDRLEKIRERAEATTTGPWEQGDINSGDGISLLDVYSEHAGYVEVASVWDSEDRDFIAHAREDIPYLLAEVERRGRVIAELMDRLRRAERIARATRTFLDGPGNPARFNRLVDVVEGLSADLAALKVDALKGDTDD